MCIKYCVSYSSYTIRPLEQYEEVRILYYRNVISSVLAHVRPKQRPTTKVWVTRKGLTLHPTVNLDCLVEALLQDIITFGVKL